MNPDPDEKICVLLFDFVGVLLFRQMDLPHDEQVEQIDRRVGRVTDDDAFKAEVMREFSLDQGGFARVLEQIVARYQPFVPLWTILPALRRHYRLGIINNGTWFTIDRFAARLDLAIFDAFLSSAREGLCKPDPRIYLIACQKLRVKPEQCLFMDDSLENVRGAQQTGMQVIHWPDPETGWHTFLAWLARENKSNRIENLTNLV